MRRIHRDLLPSQRVSHAESMPMSWRHHVSLLPFILLVAMTAYERYDILKKHNQLRGQVYPPASNMMKLVGDNNRPCHRPLTRYVNLRVAHAPGMPGTFSPPPRVSDPDMHHGTCVTHVPWCMPGSLTSGCLWSWWWRKRSWHSRRMYNPKFYVSGKRPMS